MAALGPLIDGFADDDGVVHHNPQHQQEAEHAHEIQRHIQIGQDEERAGEGGHHPERRPERHGRVQRQQQQQEDQGETLQRIREQNAEQRVVILGLVIDGGDLDASGQGFTRAIERFVHRFAGFPDVEAVGGLQRDDRRRRAVHARIEIGVLEAVDDGGHISKVNYAAIWRLPNNDGFEIELRVGEMARLQLEVSVRRAHGAGAGIDGIAAHRAGDVVECQPIGLQRRFGHFDRDFRPAHAEHEGVRPARQQRDLVAQALGRVAQRTFLDIAMHAENNRPIAAHLAGDAHRLHALRQAADRLHARAHFVG